METLGPDALNDFLDAAFPESRLPMRVTRSDDDGVELVWPVESVQLRPGNTISGPTLPLVTSATLTWLVAATMLVPSKSQRPAM